MFEAFKVGITIGLTNQVSKGLSLIGRDLLATERHLKSIQKEFNRTGYSSLAVQKRITAASGAVAAFNSNLAKTQRLALGGAVLGGAGYLGLKAIGATVKPAEEYVHQLELAKSAGLSQLEIAQATGAAWKTTGQVLTTTAADNMKAVRELRMVFGSTADAVEFLPQGQKIQAVLDSVLHGQGGVQAKDVAFTAFRALELRGASGDKKAMMEQSDLIVKGVIASGGKFTPHMLMQAQKYANPSGQHFSNDFLYGILPTLVQEMGGSTTGTMLTSLSRAVVNGRIDKKALPAWLKYGLAESVEGVTGETAKVRAKNARMFQESPFLYMQWVEGQLKAGGLTDPLARAQVITDLFSNQRAARAASLMTEQGPRLTKDFNLIGKAGTSAEYDRLVKTDPVMARQAAAAQWDNLKTVIGLQVIPILIPAIKGLADGLHALSHWGQKNQGIVKGLVWAFGGLSAAMLFGGTVLTLKAAFTGLRLLFGLTGAGSLIGGAASLASNLGPLALGLGSVGAAVAGVLAVMAYHKEIAGSIDSTGFGQRLGDNLMKARDWLASGDDLSGARRVGAPPKKSGGVTQTVINLDGRKFAEAMTYHQGSAMNRPAASTGYFDIGQGMASPSNSFAR